MSNSYIVSETVDLSDELLDALEDVTDIPATIPTKSNVVITKDANTSETVDLSDELLDALEDVTDIPATVPTKTNLAIVKYTNTYDTQKLSDELLDELEDDVPIPVTPLIRHSQQPTSAPAKSIVLEEPPFDEEDTAKVRPIRD